MSTYTDKILRSLLCSVADALAVEYMMRTYSQALLLPPPAFAAFARRTLAYLTTPCDNPQDEEQRLLRVAAARQAAQSEIDRSSLA